MAALGVNDDVALELLPEFDFSRFAEEVLGGDTEADRLVLKSSTTTKPLRASSDIEPTKVGIRSSTERTPQPLQYTTWRWYSVIATNVALCSLTTPFLVLAITNAMLNFRTVRPSQLDEIQSLNKLATTIFPLVFSMVVGRTITKYAGWQLEEGTRLETLEQLIGSRTVFGAYRTQFSLRSFNCLGLGLTLIWIISPLGGQSASRLLSTTSYSSSTPTPVKCLETRGSLNLQDGSVEPDALMLVGPLISAALVAPTSVKWSNLDTLGNVKIPYLMDPGRAWSNYTSYMDSSLYSSTIGIPIFGLLPGNTTFSIESTHIQLDCATLREHHSKEKQDIILEKPLSDQKISNGTYYGYNVNKTHWAFGMNQFPLYPNSIWYQLLGETNGDFVKGPLIHENETNIDFNRSTLLYQDKLTSPDSPIQTNGTFAQCGIIQSYVESQLFCEKAKGIQNCSVVAQRQSQKPHINTNLTWLNTNFDGFAYWLPQIHSSVFLNQWSSMQLYISHGDTDAMFNRKDNNSTGLAYMDRTLFARRLGQVINSFGIAVIAPDTFVGGKKKTYNKWVDVNATPVYQNATGMLTTTREVYVCSWIWLAMFLTATLSMLLMAILGAYYDLKTHTPEVLGYCSLLTRDSKYVTAAPGGNVLDGFDRARRFKDLRLRFGDVGIEALEADEMDGGSSTLGVGHLAVADEDKTTRARKGQLYI